MAMMQLAMIAGISAWHASLLGSQVVVDLALQPFADGLGRDGIEVGRGKDLVDDGAVRCALLGGDCAEGSA
jgi:hypothetical protein